MKKFSALTIVVGLLSVAQQAVSQSSLPPVRQLGPVTAVAKDTLVAVSGVRALSNGQLLVNDIIARRVLLFDSTMTLLRVVADTTAATANAYGVRPGGLIAYRGDSTLFVDPASLSMLLIDPAGKIVRVMSAPRAQDIGFLIGGPFGAPGFDPAGKLVYRAPPNFAAFGPPRAGANGAFQPPQIPDSAAIVRFDLATRKLDTVTFFKTPKIVMNVTSTPEGQVRVMPIVNPLPQGDDWALLPDGTIALLRTRDFHIDFLSPSGTLSNTPKIPYQWERLSDSAKVVFLDSARVAIEKQRAAGFAAGLAAGGGGPLRVTVTADGPPGGGRAGAGNTNTTVTTGAAAAPGPGGPQMPPLQLVSPSELPDYKPAFLPGSTRVDSEGNLWVRTTQNVDGRPVYDVINRKGELVDRVQLPANRVITGFGPGGIVYMAVRDGGTARLERARVR
jgi:hypothetical protein